MQAIVTLVLMFYLYYSIFDYIYQKFRVLHQDRRLDGFCHS